MKRMLAKHVMAGVVAASLATGMTPAFAAENVNTLDTVISDMTKETTKSSPTTVRWGNASTGQEPS